jgi:diacylglycerol O-acyltransferase
VGQTDVPMRNSDAFSWFMEKDPLLRSTVVTVVWLERAPDWSALCQRLAHALESAPMFRCRVEPSSRPFRNPKWKTEESLDLSWHLRRVGAPEPHTPDTVLDLARVAATTAFDSSRPPWEFTLVEGLSGGRAALVMKFHHSLTDGVGGMQLAQLLFDLEGPHEVKVRAHVPHETRHSGDGSAPCIWRGVTTAIGSVLGAGRHPLATVSNAGLTAVSVAQMLAPVTKTLSPAMTERSLGRELFMLSVELGDLKKAAAAASGTVNDAFVAALAGGLRRYHEELGERPAELRVTLPISLRREGDPAGGNRITLQRLCIPVAEPDPAERLRQVHLVCAKARSEPAIAFTDAIAGALNMLPTAVVGSMLKHVDFLASDVPGLPFKVSLAGARATGFYTFGPTIGSSMNATLLSYDETCCVGVTTDSGAIPDQKAFSVCLRDGFEEVLSLGGAHSGVRFPLEEPITES